MAEIDWSKRKVWSAAQIDAERPPRPPWGAPVEREVRRRIRCAVATYAYEIADNPIMTDAEWDRLAQEINPKLGTCHPLLDEFFVVHFSPMTGMWIHQHPELDGIRTIYERFHGSGKA